MANRSKYGCDWPADKDDLEIELDFIRAGGVVKIGRDTYGLGLVQHYKNAESILWPDDDHHRWSDLVRRRLVENEITVLMGSSDSGKTTGVAKFALIDWWAFPKETLWLLTSTEYRGSELRIWGTIKDYYNRAIEQCDWLPGRVLEGMHAITSDQIDDDQRRARSLRTGLIFIPCFVKGTLVDTPNGKVPIEQLKVGDMVYNACGLGKITETHHRTAPKIVRVKLSDGRTIDCTPEHPFFTDKGWINAIDLTHCERVYSSCETMRIVRQGIHQQPTNQTVLLRSVSRVFAAKKMPAMRRNVSSRHQTSQSVGSQFLQSYLRELVGTRPSRMRKTSYTAMQVLQQDNEASAFWTNVLFHKMSQSYRNQTLPSVRKSICLHRPINSCSKDSFLQHVLQKESDWSKMCPQEGSTDSRGTSRVESIPGIHRSFQCDNGSNHEAQSQALVSNRHRLPKHQTSRRNRRWNSPDTRQGKKGQTPNATTQKTWVESVEVLESRSDPRFNESAGGYSVHNLEVEGHPSYSVNGVVVHNCKKGTEQTTMSAFIGVKAPRLRHAGDESQHLKGILSAYSNFFGKRNFKGVISGNPLDLDDGLCSAATPEGGWDNFVDTEKTQEWKSTFYNAHVLSLDGRDSPNFDFDQTDGPRYHYLIGKKKLDGVSKTHGPDSWQWFNQCVGKPKPGLVLRRVITREFCRQHGAQDTAFWAGTAHTWIYGIDPAYGGGDRCVGMAVEFGDGLQGKQILKVHPYDIIPISLKLGIVAEDQIARYVKIRLEELQIPVENCFYDSFGKGTLGFHFAEAMGGKTPRPVNFGDKASTRPVRHDLFVEEDGKRRLKRCDEAYSKFVTELWFSVREAIQSNQMHELPTDVLIEGTQREYYQVAGARDEVEPKEDMKLRMGQSPDLFDALAVCIEGARQRGFRIETIGKEIDVKSGAAEDWLAKEAERYKRDLKKNLPNYA